MTTARLRNDRSITRRFGRAKIVVSGIKEERQERLTPLLSNVVRPKAGNTISGRFQRFLRIRSMRHGYFHQDPSRLEAKLRAPKFISRAELTLPVKRHRNRNFPDKSKIICKHERRFLYFRPRRRKPAFLRYRENDTDLPLLPRRPSSAPGVADIAPKAKGRGESN